jgi:hypothetical protein
MLCGWLSRSAAQAGPPEGRLAEGRLAEAFQVLQPADRCRPANGDRVSPPPYGVPGVTTVWMLTWCLTRFSAGHAFWCAGPDLHAPLVVAADAGAQLR